MTKKSLFVLMVFAILMLGCESGPSTTSRQQTVNVDTSDTDSVDTPVDTDKKDEKPVEQPDVPAVPVCMDECSTTLDCVSFDANPVEQAANYECKDGICIYLGCLSDAGCEAAFPNQNYKCSTKGECLRACSEPADCVRMDLFPGDDDMDENNFECTDGMCNYLGCISTMECVLTYGDSYVCNDVHHTGVPQCFNKCDESGDVTSCIEDHDNPALDSDNYDCVLQTCFYTGCNSDDECGDSKKCVKILK